jgi:2-polyprenyl-3-methyl-5-hydroxy-6-metoxy-1,4-benzoquinol methylase
MEAMTGTDRLATERHFHDRQAAERADSFRAGRADLAFADEAFLDHETWVRPAFARLGDLRGQHALDYGCGHGMAAVVMARAGARVTALDLSPGYVAETRERAATNGISTSRDSNCSACCAACGATPPRAAPWTRSTPAC